MNEPVEGRVGHDRVGEQGDPILGRTVAGDNDGSLEVPFGHDLVEVLGLDRGQCSEAEVIDDQQIGGEVFFDPLLPGVVGAAGQKEAKELEGFGEQDVIAEAAGLVAESMEGKLQHDKDSRLC